jgi:hypothetical protein
MVSVGERPAGNRSQNILKVERPVALVGATHEFLFQRVHEAALKGPFAKTKIPRILFQQDRIKIVAEKIGGYRIAEVRGESLAKTFCTFPLSREFILCLVAAGLQTG